MLVRFVREMDGPGGVRHPVGREVDHPLMVIHLYQGNALPVDDEAKEWYARHLERKRRVASIKAREAAERANEGLAESRELFGGVCPHGADPAECDSCHVESDFAADVARENAYFGGSRGRD